MLPRFVHRIRTPDICPTRIWSVFPFPPAGFVVSAGVGFCEPEWALRGFQRYEIISTKLNAFSLANVSFSAMAGAVKEILLRETVALPTVQENRLLRLSGGCFAPCGEGRWTLDPGLSEAEFLG